MDLTIETVELIKRYSSLTAVNKPNLHVEKNTVHGFLGRRKARPTKTIPTNARSQPSVLLGAHCFYERQTMVNPTKKPLKSLSFPEKSAVLER
jgi:hypothetical protein